MSRVHTATAPDGFARFEREADGTAVLRVTLVTPGLMAAGPDAVATLCRTEIDRTRAALRRLAACLTRRFVSVGGPQPLVATWDDAEERTWRATGSTLSVRPSRFDAEERFDGLDPLRTGATLRAAFDRLTDRRIDALRGVYAEIAAQLGRPETG